MEPNMYSTSVEILKYEDFRHYLKAAVEDLRCRGQFSYRKFSSHAGFSSPNFLLLLIQGDRNLSEAGATKLGMAFGLKGLKLQFFKALVQFNQCTAPQQRFKHSQTLLKFKAKLNIQFIEEDQSEYFQKWIHVAIRELLLLEPKITMDEILKRLRPSVKKQEIENSLILLTKLKLIERNADQCSVSHQSVSTGSQFVTASAFRYHQEMIELGKDSLQNFPRDQRYISGSTVSLSWDNFKTIQAKIAELRSEILALSEIDQNKEEVFQINFQLFPLTLKNTKKDSP